MKRYNALIVLCLLFCNMAVMGQHEQKLQYMGITGTLAYYKQISETHAIRIFNHKALPDSLKSILLTKYNAVRNGYEQLLLQLIADLHTKNRLYYFKRLDRCFIRGKDRKHGKTGHFMQNWNKIKHACDTLITFPTRVYIDSMSASYQKLHQDKKMNIIEKKEAPGQPAPIKLDILDPIGSIGSLFHIYRKLQFANDQKATNIAELLNNLRLRHASELIAGSDDNQADALKNDTTH